ncbi:MAG: Mov34/MPN/PAD-1 family protein [Promethearchaeati archaeon SRVP18_Atabeyarchaeia-1]
MFQTPESLKWVISTKRSVLITRSVIDSILTYAKVQHPREGILLLSGRIDSDGIQVDEVIVPPLAVHGYGFSSFPFQMLPIDLSVVGTAHSHPSGVLRPSVEDLNHFYGRVMVITAYPYDSESQIAVYDKAGTTIKYEIEKGA